MVPRMLLSTVRSTDTVAKGHHYVAHLPEKQVTIACDATGNSLQCLPERVLHASDRY
jgi:hypothetical protein